MVSYSDTSPFQDNVCIEYEICYHYSFNGYWYSLSETLSNGSNILSLITVQGVMTRSCIPCHA